MVAGGQSGAASCYRPLSRRRFDTTNAPTKLSPHLTHVAVVASPERMTSSWLMAVRTSPTTGDSNRSAQVLRPAAVGDGFTDGVAACLDADCRSPERRDAVRSRSCPADAETPPDRRFAFCLRADGRVRRLAGSRRGSLDLKGRERARNYIDVLICLLEALRRDDRDRVRAALTTPC